MANPALQPNYVTELGTARSKCDNPNHPQQKYVGQITNLQFVINSDNQPDRGEKPQPTTEITQQEPTVTETTTSWKPHQTYDSRGQGNFHQDSEGVVLTTPSGHPYCNYCKIPSHPRRSCPMRTKDLSNQVDRLYHPNKGVLESNKERHRKNKPPTAEQENDANHNIGGKSTIQSNFGEILSHHTMQDRPPEKVRRLAEQTDTLGKPKYWLSSEGKLIVSPKKLPLCQLKQVSYLQVSGFFDQ